MTPADLPESGYLVPMSAPEITEDDVAAVTAVVRSGRLALGPHCVEFEEAVAGMLVYVTPSQ